MRYNYDKNSLIGIYFVSYMLKKQLTLWLT